jgi:hypothetical protein
MPMLTKTPVPVDPLADPLDPSPVERAHEHHVGVPDDLGHLGRGVFGGAREVRLVDHDHAGNTAFPSDGQIALEPAHVQSATHGVLVGVLRRERRHHEADVDVGREHLAVRAAVHVAAPERVLALQHVNDARHRHCRLHEDPVPDRGALLARELVLEPTGELCTTHVTLIEDVVLATSLAHDARRQSERRPRALFPIERKLQEIWLESEPFELGRNPKRRHD